MINKKFLYFGLKSRLKSNKTNTNKVYSFIYLEQILKLKSNNESIIKTPKQQTLTMETKLFQNSKYISLILH
jgi:hypothetical protein